MNFHPITVHFPIALLSVYSVLELVRWSRITSQPYWFYIKAVLVVFGSLGTVAGLLTGEVAGDAAWQDVSLRPVISMHENFAHITTAIFGVLAVLYLVSWIQRSGVYVPAVGSKVEKLWNVLLKLKHTFIETKFVILIALVGVSSLLITGALGGFMVYGENVDPFVKFVYHLFF